MSLSKAFTTSKSQNWCTPKHIWKKFEQDYGVTFIRDLCSSKENHICAEFYTEKQDCRYRSWRLTWENQANWCNPPYGTGIIPDLARLAHRIRNKTNTVFLVPCNKTDQKWFHEYAVGSALILFVEGRISFLENSTPIKGNSQGSMLICFGPAFESGIGSFKQDKEIV